MIVLARLAIRSLDVERLDVDFFITSVLQLGMGASYCMAQLCPC